MSTRVAAVSEADFDRVVVQGSSTRPVVVDFWADWCGPCHQLSPMLEQAALDFEGEVDVVKVDVDANPRLSQQFGVQGIPAVKAFADGRIVAEFTGVQPPPVITQFFASLAPSAADRLVEEARGRDVAAERIVLYRQAIDIEVDHPGAALGLAQDIEDPDEAARALAQARPTAEVAQAIAELKVNQHSVDDGEVAALGDRVAAGDEEARVPLGKALAAAGRHEEAIDVLLDAVKSPVVREDARQAVLDVFTLLGNDNPLVSAARPRLAAALF